MKSGFEVFLLREFVGKNDSQTIKQFRRYFCVKYAVCLTSASLAVHSNVIEELQKFHELQNP